MNEPGRVKTLIVGAGPAGMASALELLKAGRDFTVIEKRDGVGGLARTYVIDEDGLEFRTDNGPHRFFSKNPYLYEMIGGLLDERWITVKRLTRQYINGTFLEYPVKAGQVLRVLGLGLVARALFDYAVARFRYGLLKKPIHNFEDYAVANFGRTLAEFNILNYTEKVWGVPCRGLHADWAKQRISGLNIVSLVTSTVAKALKLGKAGKPKSLVDEFYYPDLGTGLIYDAIADRVRASGRSVLLKSEPTRLFHDGARITHGDFMVAGQPQRLVFDELIESVHITDFLPLLDPKPPREVLDAAARLKFRSQVYLFITLDKERISPDQWLYYPDPKIPFARSSEMKNFSAKMSPAGKTSLFIEFFCDAGDPIYGMTAEQLFELSMPWFEKFGFFSRKEVRKIYRFQGGKDYPIYDLGYQDNLTVVKGWLDRFQNLYYVGRPGRFKYTNQDHSLEMGILAARSIIDGRRRDIEAVGTEKEYFEKGGMPPANPQSA
jgi:protoporphyrinogen oxidase